MGQVPPSPRGLSVVVPLLEKEGAVCLGLVDPQGPPRKAVSCSIAGALFCAGEMIPQTPHSPSWEMPLVFRPLHCGDPLEPTGRPVGDRWLCVGKLGKLGGEGRREIEK